ncbi:MULTISPECIES: hypothetical protein [Shewanella]|uniref:hypothetical protein n=1 Tax=Shewanella TaxID=22 RepID=UPI001182F646|nr:MULTISPECIES: hypothetical protein [Shewanella]MBY7784349.1 hypothetical protein [Vibrio fluvialis]MBO2582286.1 hypothetical protein [Shewanella algae]MBO2612014.1 hypothetical protein [Shewanella algae]MDE0568470.1 hypothetical protein [Shewanella sp. K8]MDV2960604.1 hypothetical protein [Shewanella algae]
MFEYDDLEKIDFEDMSLGRYRGLYTTTYNRFAFRVPDSEESIRICRSPKLGRDNGLNFWLAAELQDDWSDREEYFKPYIIEADFTKISEDKFNSMVRSQCSELIAQPSLPLNTGEFVGAYAMYTLDRELIVDLYAEYTDEYIHFIWESTA